MSLALAIIGDIVPPRERSKYQGYFLAVFGTSSVLGPVIGGFFAGQDTHPRHHRLALDLLHQRADRHRRASSSSCAVLHLPHTRRDHRIDWPGALALVVAPGAAADRRRAGPRPGAGTPAGRCSATPSALVGLVAFILAERAYKDDALLPLRLFRNRTFAVGGVGQHRPRRRHVRRHPAAAAVPADRARLQPHRGRPADDPARARHHDRLDRLRQTIARTGRYKIFPIIGVVLMVVALVSLSFVVERRHLAVDPGAVHGPDGPRPGLQHAAGHPGRAERRLPARDRAWPPRRSRSSARWAARSAPRSSCRSCSPGCRTEIAARSPSRRGQTPGRAAGAPSCSRPGWTASWPTPSRSRLPGCSPRRSGRVLRPIDLVFLVAAARRGDRLLRPALPAAAGAQRQVGHPGPAGGRGGRAPRSRRTSRPSSRSQSVGAAAPTSTAPPAGTAEDPRR